METNSRNRLDRIRQRAAAFTLIEILVVILILGILAAFFGNSQYAQTEGARLSTAQTVLLRNMPVAIQSYYSTHSPDDPPSKQDLVDRGVPAETPWVRARWYIRTSPGVVSVHYPAGNGGDLAQSLENAKTIARYFVAEDAMGAYGDDPEKTEIGRTESIKRGLSFVRRVRIKDLANDRVSGSGLMVIYKVSP